MVAAPAEVTMRRPRLASASRVLWQGPDRRERVALATSILAFLGMTIWWLSQDQGVQDWDNGLHTVDALIVKNDIATGHLSAVFTQYLGYPPFGHLIGALGIFIGGFSPASVIMAENLVFVPLLAVSCYGIGKLVYGTALSGLLAALFALGTPMVTSEMHEFLLDPQQASIVAAAVWGILASRRFERVGIATLAGVAAGLAMMTKQTSVFFFVGPAAVAFLRGGWREWRGLTAYIVAIAVVAAPWYVYHLPELQSASGVAASTAVWVPAGATVNASRFSALNLGYYLWDALNLQILAPLCLLFGVGVLEAIRRLLPLPRRDDLRLDLLVGCLVGWLGVGVLLVDKDPRYSLPDLVYIAVIGTGWIGSMRWRRPRRILAAAVVVIAFVNFAGVSTGTGGVLQTTLPGHTPGTIERELTFYSPDGWLRGGPTTDGHIPSLMTGLYRAGIRTLIWEGASTDLENFNQSGLNVRAIEAGMNIAELPANGVLGPHVAFVLGHYRVAGDPPPCRQLEEGEGVYVVIDNAFVPFETYTFICPGRHPEIYRRTAPLSPDVEAAIEPALPRPWLERYTRLFRDMREQGITEVQVDYASSDVPFFARVQTLALASHLGLAAEPFNPGTHDVDEAFLVRHAAGAGEPPPCLRFPDGTGLYIVRGYAYIPFNQYEFYCPTRTPRMYAASTR
jgi:hypothetical protein